MKQPNAPRTSWGKFFALTFILLLATLAIPAILGWRDLYVNYLENDPPIILVTDPPAGIGEQPTTVQIQVKDGGSGLDEVIIRQDLDGELTELLRQRYRRETKKEDTLSLVLPGKASGIPEGSVKIVIAAFDRSFWSNKKSLTLEIPVDYHPPAVEVLSTQHNVVRGGCEIVFYRMRDSEKAFSAVKAGTFIFPGFKASTLDKDFAADPNLYFALFAIPLNFDPEKDKIRISAHDAVKNYSTVPIPYRLGDFTRAKRARKLDEMFMSTRVDPLYERYMEKGGDGKERRKEPVMPATTTEEQIARFREVNEDYRRSINRQLEKIFTSPKAQRMWAGRFVWFPGAMRAFFGEEQSFTYRDSAAGSLVSEGVEIAAVPGSLVRAANGGSVIFVDDLAVYGKTVIIDHGFGLTSMYSFLGDFANARSGIHEGDTVRQGDPIGVTGETGLTPGNVLHYEMRLNGMPVRPAEWWDGQWIEGHIEQKIRDMKKLLGLQMVRPVT